MIELVVQGIHLPVKQQPLSFRFKNPILHKADGSVIYNLDVPITPVSQAAFNYIERLQSKTFGQKEPLTGELKINGYPLGTVSLQIDSATDTVYRVSAGLNRGMFNYQAKDAQLREVLSKVEYVLPTDSSIETVIEDSGIGDNQFPFITCVVRNTAALEDAAGWAPIQPGSLNWFYQNEYDTIPYATKFGSTYTPFYRLAYVIEQLAGVLGLKLTFNALRSIEELTRLIVYSNNYRFLGLPFSAYIPDTWRLGDFMPKMTVLEFLDTVETVFNAKFLPNSTTKEAEFIFVDPFFDPEKTINLHIPENALTEVSFLKKKDSYRFSFTDPNDSEYGNKVKDLSNGDYTFKGKVTNQAALPDPDTAKWGDVYQAEDTGFYYELSLNDDEEMYWKFLSIDLQPELIGDADQAEDIKVNASPVISGMASSYDAVYNIECPIVGTPAFGVYYNGPYKDTGGLRLMFYRAFRSIGSDPGYPFASSDNRFLNGSPIPGAQYAIRWQGAGGLLEKFWPKRLNWMKKNNIPVQCQKVLSLRELSEWDWKSGYLVGSRKCLSSIIEGEITPDGVVKARLELYPL